MIKIICADTFIQFIITFLTNDASAYMVLEFPQSPSLWTVWRVANPCSEDHC